MIDFQPERPFVAETPAQQQARQEVESVEHEIAGRDAMGWLLTADQASQKLCHKTLAATVASPCLHARCMAWQWNDEKGVPLRYGFCGAISNLGKP